MNSVQVHLALTHVPVILSLTGLIMLLVAFYLKNNMLTRSSYILIAIAGLAALPVYFTGEATEEAVENLPGVGKAMIERHEEVARLAMVAIALAGLVALAALMSFKWQVASRVLKTCVLLLAITSGGLMAQTAHLGGQIRHTEIRNGAIQNNNAKGSDNEGNGVKKDQDND